MSTPINQIRGMSGGNSLPPVTMQIYDPTPPSQPQYQSQGQQPQYQSQQAQMMPSDMTTPGGGNPLVDDILREFDAPPGEGYTQDLNVGSINYAMDSVHVPPPMNAQAMKHLQGESTQVVAASEAFIPSPSDTSMSLGITKGNSDLMARIITAAKPLLTVFIIVLIMSLHHTNRFLFSFFPQLLLENGQLSIYAILLRCTLATLLYYLATLLF